jgi:hypothetical protein
MPGPVSLCAERAWVHSKEHGDIYPELTYYCNSGDIVPFGYIPVPSQLV